jgi:predicted TIM-barrel fold metal-dependent hydrolase
MSLPKTDAEKPQIINCHTHIFTGDSVPPWLAKTFLPFPFYYLFPISGIVKFLRWWYDGPYRIRFSTGYKKLQRSLYNIKMILRRVFILSLLKFFAGIFLMLNIFYAFYNIFNAISPADNTQVKTLLMKLRDFLITYHIIPQKINYPLLSLYIFLLLLFFQSGRNLIIFALKYLFKFLKFLPGKQTGELIKRYILIGRFSRYKTQDNIYYKLAAQYPKDTGIVILPMDMEYMGAGRLKNDYRLEHQMAELAALKKKLPHTFFPFVFADPRRLKEDPSYFKFTSDAEGKIIPDENCLVRKWVEKENFNGIKIYPALGYFPFDKDLLVLFKYAADRGLPITTHCIRGTIFYRGSKEKEWDTHPIFMQSMGREKSKNDIDEDSMDEESTKTSYCPMLLPETNNVDFSVNFTHPLNYLCLLEEKLLRQVVAKSGDDAIKEVFGYTNDETPMLRNLSHLKLCFGHFGGDDEWHRFMENDRDIYSSQLVKRPNRGIEFLCSNDGKDRPGKPELIWKYADWYTIICSMMLQYPNVYADISYILHQPEIMPLLKQTMKKEVLRERVLFGTDFYVVRNHKSDKDMLAEMMAGLSEEEFDLMARTNPHNFLKGNEVT